MPNATISGFDLQYAVGWPPKDAVAYFRSKGFAVSDHWWEIWQGANAKAFTVAKATRMDVLESIRAALDKSLVDGMTERAPDVSHRLSVVPPTERGYRRYVK